MSKSLELPTIAPPFLGTALLEYGLELAQRNLLFLDVLRQRGNQYHEHLEKTAPDVLSFDAQTVINGTDLPRPVNYSLMRIVPPPGVTIDPIKRPFVVVDPRAGHGPGIGGFKPDSEIGVAMRAGHICYFVSFLPAPVPGQTVTDVIHAEAAFLEHVIRAHPEAEGKPVVIGNCQAGWQVMMGAALRPDLFGPLIIAGSPLSYWAGQRGGPPMRYSGGLLGGSWVTALASDIGSGLFDGSWLVHNFERLDPANTLFVKQYNLHRHIDTEPARYLGFERWWNNHVLLNAEEMQFIVDQLFVGNRLATCELTLDDGTKIDLRNIRSPIVVFCSKGDNITPPAQALGWIADLYESVDDIRAHGQTIVYTVHESIGHLGIFVSASVARKEHEEFASNIDFIDILPPGLYEAEITEQQPQGPNPSYLLRFVARELNDVREIVHPREDDERRFATARRVSEINLDLYRTFVQPWVRAAVSEPMAESIRRLHPLRLSYDLFSDRNPWLLPVAIMASHVQAMRRSVSQNNPFSKMESEMAEWIERSLDDWQSWRDKMKEDMFLWIYGQPALQALMEVSAAEAPRRRPCMEPAHRAFLERRIGELMSSMSQGGAKEAVLRSIAFVVLAERVADERRFEQLRSLLAEEGHGGQLQDFKQDVRSQFFMLLLDTEKALATLPGLLEGGTADQIGQLLEEIHRITRAGGPLTEQGLERLKIIEDIFTRAQATAEKDGPSPTNAPRKNRPDGQAKPQATHRTGH